MDGLPDVINFAASGQPDISDFSIAVIPENPFGPVGTNGSNNRNEMKAAAGGAGDSLRDRRTTGRCGSKRGLDRDIRSTELDILNDAIGVLITLKICIRYREQAEAIMVVSGEER